MSNYEKSAPPPYSATAPSPGFKPEHTYGPPQHPVLEQPHIINVTTVSPIIVSQCPKCHISPMYISTNYSIGGWCLAFCFFPIGILCCILGCQEKSCSNCGFRLE